MIQKIYSHRYVMHSRRGLNSRSHTTEHEGALIRVDVDGVSGFGCLHPWVELGDSSLDDLLEEIQSGRSSRQVRCALECAEIDRRARAAGVNLFDGLDVPKSHATIVGGIDSIESAVVAGFDTVKLKMGRSADYNLKLLGETHREFPNLKLRLDFNGVSSFSAIDEMLSQIGESLQERIDFIEDPYPFDNISWNVLRDRYAMKFGVDRGLSQVDGEFDISVVKPAINDTDRICNQAQLSGRSVVVTSYMDHPLGQCFAAYNAGKMNAEYLGVVNDCCGLMTHGLFDHDAFIEVMGDNTPTWNKSRNGIGFGFDDLLERLDWKIV